MNRLKLIGPRKVKRGDRLIVQTRGGGSFSGERIITLLKNQERRVYPRIGTVISFAGPVEVIGSRGSAAGGARSPGGVIDERIARITSRQVPDNPKESAPCLEFLGSGLTLFLHFIHPGQVARVLKAS